MNKSAKDSVFGILWLISGLAMIIVGITALFSGGVVVGTVSKLIGICAVICGIISILARIMISSIAGAEGRLMSVDSILLIVVGILFLNTGILRAIGKFMFIIIGAVIIYNAVQSLFSAFKSRKNDDGWFLPRIIASVLLLMAGIWVFSNAGRVFADMAGLVAGVYFIFHGLEVVNDWIGRERYRRNFAHLDDED